MICDAGLGGAEPAFRVLLVSAAGRDGAVARE
jgi:hypothetical protein